MLAEWLLYGLLGLVSLMVLVAIPVTIGLIAFRTAVITLGSLIAVAGAILLQLNQLSTWKAVEANSTRAAVPTPRKDHIFAGSSSCRSCHAKEYDTWHNSFHRTMTQVATPESVIAPFDGRTLTRYQQDARVERRGEEFWVNMVDPFWNVTLGMQGVRPPTENQPRAEFRIVMTTGSHCFQAYWYLADDTGELWLFPWRYIIEDHAWVHVDDVFLQAPPDHPASGHNVWNKTCIACHSVAGQPGRNSSTGRFDQTHVAELGISCEACHGPATEHIKANQNPLQRYQKHLTTGSGDPTVFNPERADQHLSALACGSCHSHFQFDPAHESFQNMQVTGQEIRPGHDLLERGRFMTVADDVLMKDGDFEITVARFWADGACRSGGREYNGMIDSACYLKGEMTCLSCHTMHGTEPDDQLKPGMRTNTACLQCHQRIADDVPAHTHHSIGSSGSECVNCHMPYTSYALLRGIRSHRIDSPRVVPFAENVRLNACNLCHLEQTQQWTATQLQQWYGTEAPLLGEEDRSVAASLIWLLKGDAGQRALSGWHFGWPAAHHDSGVDWMKPFLAILLQDPYSAVRYSSWKALVQHKFLSESALQDLREVLFEDVEGRRLRTSDELLDKWIEEMNDRAYPRPAALPGGGIGFSEAALRELLKQRNDRPMVVVE